MYAVYVLGKPKSRVMFKYQRVLTQDTTVFGLNLSAAWKQKGNIRGHGYAILLLHGLKCHTANIGMYSISTRATPDLLHE